MEKATILLSFFQNFFANPLTACVQHGIFAEKGGDNMGGSISENNTRTQLTLSKELKAQLQAVAKEQNRSFNNLCVTILQNYLKHNHK